MYRALQNRIPLRSIFYNVLRIQPFCAFHAESMAELGVGMRADIGFQLMPCAFIVADLLAGRTDGQYSLKGF